MDNHDLRQINQAYIESLDIETAKKPASKLLEDLKEARERLNQNPTRRRIGEFLHDREAIFRAPEHPELPLTNNEAERILRHWVIIRRLCYGTRTKQGSRTVGPVSRIF